MMSCKDTVARLQTFLDRELSEVEVAEVRMHLGACPPCRDHFHFEERLKRLVHDGACPERAPLSLRQRIARQIHEA